MKKNALIYSISRLYAHDQTYAQHLIEALLKLGYQVHLAINSVFKGKPIPCIDPYQTHPSVHLEYIPDVHMISLADLRGLQDKVSADLTVLLNADQHLKILTSQILPGNVRLRGKNLGIFVTSTNYFYKAKQTHPLFKGLRFLKHWVIRSKANLQGFHEIILPGFHVLDAALTIDEYFAAHHARSHQWIPDMVFPLLPDEPSAAQAECQYWSSRLQQFLERNLGREVLFCFGGASGRKGYDTLLRLAVDTGSCLIHSGVLSSVEMYMPYEEDVPTLKNILQTRGQLFETDTYIQSYAAMRLFFNTCQYLVLPYRKHFGSSGVMLQAAHFGKPVLVPDQGLMALRTRSENLGLTYQPENYDSLMAEWLHMKETSTSFIGRGAEYFENQFSGEKIQQALTTVMQPFAP